MSLHITIRWTELSASRKIDESSPWGVISWITLARRPLTREELQTFLAVETGKTELDEENKPQEQEMISVCEGLVEVDNNWII